MTRQQILDEAMRLPSQERHAIAEALLHTVDEPISDEWKEELARRVAEADADPTTLHDGEAVFAEVRAKLRQLRGEA